MDVCSVLLIFYFGGLLMTDIQILATTEHDYPFGTLTDDQNQAWARLTSSGYSRLQIQRAIVRELENMDVTTWSEFQTAIERHNAGEGSYDFCTQLQWKTYRVRARLGNCTRELKRQEAKQVATF
jgi:hypothetical protein